MPEPVNSPDPLATLRAVSDAAQAATEGDGDSATQDELDEALRDFVAYINAVSPARVLALVECFEELDRLHQPGPADTFCSHDGFAWPCMSARALARLRERLQPEEGER